MMLCRVVRQLQILLLNHICGEYLCFDLGRDIKLLAHLDYKAAT